MKISKKLLAGTLRCPLMGLTNSTSPNDFIKTDEAIL